MSFAKGLAVKCAAFMEKGDTKRLAVQEVTQGIHKQASISYLADSNPYHLLDVYYPEGTENLLPVIIDIHGGGLFYGDKELNRNYARYLSSFGYTVVMPSYRLVTDGSHFDDEIRDIFAVFKWTTENIGNYHGDTEHLFVTGDSAGGLLAAYSALVNEESELQTLYKVKRCIDIKAIGLVSGMFLPRNGIFMKPFQSLFFGDNYKDSPLYKSLDFNTVPGLEKLPPAYLVSSEQDFIKSHTLSFVDSLKRRGVEHKFHMWGKPTDKSYKLEHVFSVTFPLIDESKETTAELIDWFVSHDVKVTVR